MEVNERIVENPYGFIYITTNMVNGKRYLGQKRFEYGKDWRNYLGSGIALKRAIDTYGKENFYKNIVCFCYSEEELNQAEHDLSVFLDVVRDPNWYNMILGGQGKSGYKMSEEEVEALRQRAFEQMKNPEAREHLSQLARERNNTEEAKARQSAMMKELWQDDAFREKVMGNKHYASGEDHHMFGYQWSEEQRQHMREIMLEKNKDEEYKKRVRESRTYTHGPDNPLYGIPKSEDLKRKISESRKGKCVGEENYMYGKHHSDEFKQNLREKAIQRAENGIPPFKGKKHSEESRAKMRESSRKRWERAAAENPDGKITIRQKRAVVQLTLDGNFVATYESAKEASRQTGVCASSIPSVCSGRRRSAGGFRWMYLEDYEKLTQQNDLNNEQKEI